MVSLDIQRFKVDQPVTKEPSAVDFLPTAGSVARVALQGGAEGGGQDDSMLHMGDGAVAGGHPGHKDKVDDRKDDLPRTVRLAMRSRRTQLKMPAIAAKVAGARPRQENVRLKSARRLLWRL